MSDKNIVLYWKNQDGRFNASSKAKDDVLKILNAKGFVPVYLFSEGTSRLYRKLQIILSGLKLYFSVDRHSKIVLQYPFSIKMINMTLTLLRMVQKKRKNKLYCVIHDFDSLRNKSFLEEKDFLVFRREIERLCHFDMIICHNSRMQWLIKQAGYEGKIKVLGPFDYLYDGAMPIHRWSGKYEVVIAGNLSRKKSAYLYQLPQLDNVEFRLFGVGFEEYNQSNIKYCGSFLPEELIEHLNGNFGLVWDGISAETCAGEFGEYLRWNNPHKLSMCIVAGLPIIIWDQAALASYVLENDIGVTVYSLRDISKLNITDVHYQKMVENIRVIREDLIRGKHLLKALELE